MGSQHLKALSVSKKAKLHSIVDVNKNSIIKRLEKGDYEFQVLGKGQQ